MYGHEALEIQEAMELRAVEAPSGKTRMPSRFRSGARARRPFKSGTHEATENRVYAKRQEAVERAVLPEDFTPELAGNIRDRHMDMLQSIGEKAMGEPMLELILANSGPQLPLRLPNRPMQNL